MTVRIGTAGWAIPRMHAGHFPGQDSQLQRYSRVLPVVEINSTFRHEHRAETFARWAESTPHGFRFSLKLPHGITHEHRLRGPSDRMVAFLAGARLLGVKLGPLLAQLPPSLAFEPDVADAFFARLRREHPGPVVCEPRNATWFTEAADALLRDHRISRVAADPMVIPSAGLPGGWDGLRYYRLHGSPRKYFSAYTDEFIGRLAEEIISGGEVWCIFDNTAHGAAAGDGVKLAAAVPPTLQPTFYRPPMYARTSSP